MPNQTDRELRFSDLTPARRQLVRILQRLGHGRVERLAVRGGQPAYSPVPTLVADRPGSPPRRELLLADFVLKGRHRDLLAALERLGDGVVARIDVQGGLPVRVVLAAASS